MFFGDFKMTKNNDRADFIENGVKYVPDFSHDDYSSKLKFTAIFKAVMVNHDKSDNTEIKELCLLIARLSELSKIELLSLTYLDKALGKL